MKIQFFAVTIAFFFSCSPSNAQNLIKNGGFEQHGKIECMQCYHLYGKYPAVVYHWDNMGWGCLLFDKDYPLNSDEKKWNPLVNPVEAHQGKAMINSCAGSTEYSRNKAFIRVKSEE